MRLVFERTDRQSRIGSWARTEKFYLAVLASQHHPEVYEPLRVVIAEIHPGHWEMPRRPRREIRWILPTLRTKPDRLWDYADTLAEAKSLIEERLVWFFERTNPEVTP